MTLREMKLAKPHVWYLNIWPMQIVLFKLFSKYSRILIVGIICFNFSWLLILHIQTALCTEMWNPKTLCSIVWTKSSDWLIGVLLNFTCLGKLIMSGLPQDIINRLSFWLKTPTIITVWTSGQPAALSQKWFSNVEALYSEVLIIMISLLPYQK